jgi:MFS transporter, ACS family, D-galactonate transporter
VWSYTLSRIPAGLLLDRIGMKCALRVTTWVWALACFLTAVASGTGLVLASRILFGVAEAAVFPGSIKVTGYWLPRAERVLSTAVFDSGQRLSNVIGTPLVALAVVELGWRGAFWTTGVLSVVFAALFWIGYRNPKEALRSGRLGQAEYEYIRAGGAQDEDVAHPNPLANLGYVPRRRKVWGLSLGLARAGYTSWLLLTWLPNYLQTALHTTVLKSGVYTAVPWLVAVAVEFVVPGWLVDHLIRRGRAETVVRKAVLIAGMVVGLGIVGAGVHHQPGGGAVLDHRRHRGDHPGLLRQQQPARAHRPEGGVGAVASVMNFVNTLFGLAAPIVTGFLVQATGSFAPAFLVARVIMLARIFFYTVVLGRIEQIPAPPGVA